MEYNTLRNHLEVKEYGRHIQKMIEYCLTIEDRDKRNMQAKAVIELMGFLNPHLKNVEDFRHMLWDHLFVISNFQLDVDSPYPIPQKETYKQRPEPLHYPRRYPKYSHLGKNLEIVIDKALKEENPEKKAGFANAIAYYMKLSYSNWHKELVHDDAIRSELDAITGGELEFSNTPYIKHRNQNFVSDDYPANNGRRQNNYGRDNNNRNNGGQQRMGGRDNRNNAGGQRDNRNNVGGQRDNWNNPGGQRDNRNNNRPNNNNNDRNFKKRY
ncbi:MAG: DUF4290 domain-containing protein [Chitinophagaceae bacterium]|nr:DUF4290 domain-containing protein [Chitinophagaceae bacterium]